LDSQENRVAEQLKRFRAVVFDFDGTLVDSYPAITASVNHVRGLYGLPPLSVSEVCRHVGRGADYLLKLTVPQGEVAANVAAYRAHHPSVVRSGTQFLPGALESLRSLKQQGKHLGICSNKPSAFTRELVAYLEIAVYLDVILGPEDVARPKPAPDMLLLAIQRLHLTPDEVLYVGDMTVDIETARGAGVTVWVVPTGSEERDALVRARPDRLLTDLHQLPGLLGSKDR
jgi:phosphoglycolate phosphatase